ncbi:MAG TPA: glycosyltransferase, partial [Candidatus Dormibacteraeota bacterium]|nr:glycosyltransferase [Candidatus Dormibacteraeota bacterium]
GFERCTGERVVTMDADLQNPPEEIPRLLARLDDGFDVVYGRPVEPMHDRGRVLASRVTKSVLQGAMGAEAASAISSFRAFRTELREAFAAAHGSYVNIDVFLSWASSSFGAVDVRHDRRAHGESNYTFRRLVTHAVNMVTGYSVAPLRFASLVGFSFFLFGIAVLGYVLIRYAANHFESVPGFPFLASIVAIFSGAQLFAVGVIGEYLARMHFRMLDKPTYAIRDIRRGEDAGAGVGVAPQLDGAAITGRRVRDDEPTVLRG